VKARSDSAPGGVLAHEHDQDDGTDQPDERDQVEPSAAIRVVEPPDGHRKRRQKQAQDHQVREYGGSPLSVRAYRYSHIDIGGVAVPVDLGDEYSQGSVVCH